LLPEAIRSGKQPIGRPMVTALRSFDGKAERDRTSVVQSIERAEIALFSYKTRHVIRDAIDRRHGSGRQGLQDDLRARGVDFPGFGILTGPVLEAQDVADNIDIVPGHAQAGLATDFDDGRVTVGVLRGKQNEGAKAGLPGLPGLLHTAHEANETGCGEGNARL